MRNESLQLFKKVQGNKAAQVQRREAMRCLREEMDRKKMKSYSQMSQDVFANWLFGRSGYFLDLGCGDGVSRPCGNNTYALELLGWTGYSVDFNPQYTQDFLMSRKTPVGCYDLSKVGIEEILGMGAAPGVVQYLSLDCDEALPWVIEGLDLSCRRYGLVTAEHNAYSPKYKGLKEKISDKFLSHGYEIVAENVCHRGRYVEDWYIHPWLIPTNKALHLAKVAPAGCKDHREIVSDLIR